MLKWHIGDVTITRIVELEMATSDLIIAEATPESLATMPWLSPHFVTPEGALKISIHALVIETPKHRVIVDTCVGNEKPRPIFPFWDQLQKPFLQDLTAAGFPPETIDTVLCTHLHVDHVGWNTMLVDGKWVPTFRNARYLMGRNEFTHWADQADQEGLSPYLRETQVAVMADSIKPIFDAGLVDLVETDHRLCDEISLIPTLGHTPGHVSVRIASKGQEALITGDFVHHPCQMGHTDWTSGVDYDAAQATRTRNEVFGRLAETPTLVTGTHFATPTAGRIRRDGTGFRFEVAEPSR